MAELEAPTEPPPFQAVKAEVAKCPPLEGEFIVRKMMNSSKFIGGLIFVNIIIFFAMAILFYIRQGRVDASAVVLSIFFAFPGGLILTLASWVLIERLMPWALNATVKPIDIEAAATREYIRVQMDYERRMKAAEDWRWAQTMKPWHEADGPTFERLVARVFRNQGWLVEHVGGANDGGVDIRLRNGELLVLVQCKAHARPIPQATLRDLYGAMHHEHAVGALLVCRNGVTEAARAWISGKPIGVMTPEQLVRAGGVPL